MKILEPGAAVSRKTYQIIIAAWIFCAAMIWCLSPSVFLPTPSETWAALRDLWLYQNLAQALWASVVLNMESVLIALVISLVLVYAATLPAFRPVTVFIGELRFLSFYGLAFAFVLIVHNGQALKISVLVFMVTVFFVVSMMDVVAAIPREQYDLCYDVAFWAMA